MTDMQFTGKYFAVEGSPYTDADAQLIGNYLRELSRQLGMELENIPPSVIWERVQADPGCPIRQYFEWDKQEAWRKHNVDVVRRLVRSIRAEVILVEAKGPIVMKMPAFVSAELRDHRTSYIPLDEAIKSERVIAQMKADALRQARYWYERYQEYRRFSQFDDLDPIFQTIANIPNAS